MNKNIEFSSQDIKIIPSHLIDEEKESSSETVNEVAQSKLQNIRPTPPPRPLQPAPLPSSSSRTRENLSQHIYNQRVESNLGGGGMIPSSSEKLAQNLFLGVAVLDVEKDIKPAEVFSTVIAQQSSDDSHIVETRSDATTQQIKKPEEEGLQMDYIYRLIDAPSNFGLAVTEFGDVSMQDSTNISTVEQMLYFSQLVEIIRERARSSELPVCELSDGSIVTYSELLHRLSSSEWGRQVLQKNPELKTNLNTLYQKLVWIEFNVPSKMREWLAKQEKQWQKKGKDVEMTFPNLSCKVFYRAQSQQIYVMPLNVQEKGIHFLGRGEFKSASRLLNYTTGEIFACCDMEKITAPDRKGLKQGITPKSIKEVECLQKLKGATGVISLIDDLEYIAKGEKKGEDRVRLVMMTPLYGGGLLGRKGAVQEQYAQLGRKEKIEIMRELLLGLKAIHQVGIVHHDIDISNILMRRDPNTNQWHAAIFDFGQAELVSEGGKGAKTVIEQGVSSDIFEMGIVFYRLFIDSDTKHDFKSKEWAQNYKQIYDQLTGPDLPIKQAVMQMLAPAGARLNEEMFLSVIQ